jgi:hypothetical protein
MVAGLILIDALTTLNVALHRHGDNRHGMGRRCRDPPYMACNDPAIVPVGAQSVGRRGADLAAVTERCDLEMLRAAIWGSRNEDPPGVLQTPRTTGRARLAAEALCLDPMAGACRPRVRQARGEGLGLWRARGRSRS